jgi:hypothetical protein
MSIFENPLDYISERLVTIVGLQQRLQKRAAVVPAVVAEHKAERGLIMLQNVATERRARDYWFQNKRCICTRVAGAGVVCDCQKVA